MRSAGTGLRRVSLSSLSQAVSLRVLVLLARLSVTVLTAVVQNKALVCLVVCLLFARALLVGIATGCVAGTAASRLVPAVGRGGPLTILAAHVLDSLRLDVLPRQPAFLHLL